MVSLVTEEPSGFMAYISQLPSLSDANTMRSLRATGVAVGAGVAVGVGATVGVGTGAAVAVARAKAVGGALASLSPPQAARTLAERGFSQIS